MSDVPWLRIVGARQNNLRNLTVDVPLKRFVCVTGVSGSGKSSLVNDIMRNALERELNGVTKSRPGAHDRIEGLSHLDKVIDIDQSPIGRTPRSNPATYIKVFDGIRSLFTKLPDARIRGYKPGRFSFNVKTGRWGGGRCEACEGNGSNRIEMEFLTDVWVTCPVCEGHRFNRETLQVRYKGKSIADVLEMDVQEALTHFESVPGIVRMLRTLHDVGLDYIKLGQSSTTLSGGEAQRIKLARELVKQSTGKTLYLLDEPTTGLHFADIRKLLTVLHGFVDAGNSVVVIEHNLDVIKTADWVIDLGPEGGADGGSIVAAGTPEQIARCRRSYTGQALAVLLDGAPDTPSARRKESIKPSRDRKGATILGSDSLSLPHGRGSERARASGDRLPAGSRSHKTIRVVGARENNLKDVTVDVPRGKMSVCCGPSGSGKSSFAMDTLYAEGRRRYVESLSAYARQFLGRLSPPKVDQVDGLSPAICIEQKNASKSPRSTVGTVTEIHDYLRVLWARIGEPHCPQCHVPIGTQSSDEIVERILSFPAGTRLLLLAPIEPAGNESYAHLFRREQANGYARVRVDGRVHPLGVDMGIDAKRRHDVELVVDRIVVQRSRASRIADSVEQALAVGRGVLIVQTVERDEPSPAGTGGGDDPGGPQYRYSQHRSCDQCGRSFDQLTPHHFSFNSRLGWCEACEGLGIQQGASPAAIVVHPTRSIADGAIGAWGALQPGTVLYAFALAVSEHIGFDLHARWNDLAPAQQLSILQGCGDDWVELGAGGPPRSRKRNHVTQHKNDAEHAPGRRSRPLAGYRSVRFKWRGFFPSINRATRVSWQYRKRLEDLVTEVPCERCGGGRLRPDAAAVRVAGATLHDVETTPLGDALAWFRHMKLDTHRKRIAGDLLKEVVARLQFLVDVGLGYITLHRTSASLSGGESQRIQLASQIGTGLTGVLYVLDEPTIGLHPRDNGRLTAALTKLRDLGNTLLLVEHDREVIDSADHLLDFGPGAGVMGGEVTATGTPSTIRRRRASLTGRYLSHKETIPVPSNRRPVPSPGRRDVVNASGDTPDALESDEDESKWLTVVGAREHNLKEIDVSFPLSRFVCVTGVSGSGKSSLANAILCNALMARLHRARVVPGGHDRILGVEHIDKVINVDQSPIGNSPTSNPATYTGVFDHVRTLFATLPLSKVRGYSANRFSFNRPGGRCEACEGMGRRCIEMHFLPDVWIECESCGGKRYTRETLEVQYRGRSIADILDMSVAEAKTLFENVPRVRRMMQTLDDVGMGYVQLGQPAPTLSGGEAQRVKLAAELGRPQTGKTLYILDEPTTGLHFDDLKKLLRVIHRLTDLGNTVICIEHNLDVIKTADWIIDLGPEAGAGGGEIVVEGTPERVAARKESHTGRALAPLLAAGPLERRPVYRPEQDVTWEQNPEDTLGTTDDEDVRLPWERDGVAWHTVGHVDRLGRKVEWDPDVVRWLVRSMEAIGAFAPVDWNNRARIEITASKGKYWFCHILTGGKDLLDVKIRAAEGSFVQTALARKLAIQTLDERKDLPIYGQWSRVRVRSLADGWTEIGLWLRDFQDVRKPAFREFLRRAAGSYMDRLRGVAANPQEEKPWLADGEAWHLSQKSIHKRHVIQWKPAALPAVIGLFKLQEPGLKLDWQTRTAVRLFRPGESAYSAKIVTNIGEGMRIELRAPRNELTPALVDRLGRDVELRTVQGNDWVTFWVRQVTDIDRKQLRDVWRRCGVARSRLEVDLA